MLKKILKLFFAIAFLLSMLGLSGCGGGGGGAQGSTSVATGSAKSGVTVVLTDLATGATTTTLPPSGTVVATATVKDGGGNAVAGTIVTFSDSSGFAAFSPPSGKVLTNSSGVAQINLSPVTGTTGGATNVLASVTLGSGTSATQVTSSGAPLTVVAAAASISLAIANSAGTATTTLTTSSPLTVKATLRDANGDLVKNALVSFSMGSALAAYSPSSATASTGDGAAGSVLGEASIGLSPVAGTPGGATNVFATAKVNGVEVTSASIVINVVGANGSSSGTPTLTLQLSTNSITFGTPVDVTATVKNGSGTPQPNVVVNFSTNKDLVTMTPPLGSAMTDASGIARIQMSAANLTAAGADYLTATSNSFPSASLAYSVGAPSVTLAPMVLGTTNLSASGTTSVSVDVSINGAVPKVPVTVSFSSQCATSGKATITASVVTQSSGSKATATATYTDNGCGGSLSTPTPDEITATVAGQSVKGTLNVAGAQAANIQFVSLNPATGILVLKGTGGVNYSEVGNVKFQVVNNSGKPVANQSVDFSLTTYVGGIQIDGVGSPPLGTPPTAPPCGTSTSALTKITDGEGFVSVNVQSGSVPTPVWVKATTCTPSGNAVSSQSNKMVISTGVPAQDFFSLAPAYYNIEGWAIDAEPSWLNILASDRLGNPVPDGTAINFISEGAQVTPSTCATDKGACKVKLLSAEARPTDGRVSVTAYALGEESFIDSNNNNVWDSGEPYDDLGNVFIDKNEDRTFQTGEQQVVFKSSNQLGCSIGSLTTNPAQTVTLSSAAPPKLADAPWADNTCDGTWGQAHVRRSRVIVLSDSSLSTVTDLSGNAVDWSMGTSCSKSFDVQIMDKNRNPLPFGTRLYVGGNTNTITYVSGGTTGTFPTLTISPLTVPNTNRANGSRHTITVTGSCTTATWAGFFDLQAVSGPNPDSPRYGSPGSNTYSTIMIQVK
jgi:hypothetical protein